MTRKHSLDDQRLCFLSFFYSNQEELESTNFDVEAADDYHYQIYNDQIPILSEYFQCNSDESSLTAAFTEQLNKLSNPINMVDVLRRAGVKFQTHYWH